MDTEREINANEDWIAAGWGEAWHPDNIDVWDFIAEVLNYELDYLADAGYV